MPLRAVQVAAPAVWKTWTSEAEMVAAQLEPPVGVKETRMYGAVRVMEVVAPLMVSPEAGAMTRVLVEVTAPATSTTSRVAVGQVWPTQEAPAEGRVQVREAVSAVRV